MCLHPVHGWAQRSTTIGLMQPLSTLSPAARPSNNSPSVSVTTRPITTDPNPKLPAQRTTAKCTIDTAPRGEEHHRHPSSSCAGEELRSKTEHPSEVAPPEPPVPSRCKTRQLDVRWLRRRRGRGRLDVRGRCMGHGTGWSGTGMELGKKEYIDDYDDYILTIYELMTGKSRC